MPDVAWDTPEAPASPSIKWDSAPAAPSIKWDDAPSAPAAVKWDPPGVKWDGDAPVKQPIGTVVDPSTGNFVEASGPETYYSPGKDINRSDLTIGQAPTAIGNEFANAGHAIAAGTKKTLATGEELLTRMGAAQNEMTDAGLGKDPELAKVPESAFNDVRARRDAAAQDEATAMGNIESGGIRQITGAVNSLAPAVVGGVAGGPAGAVAGGGITAIKSLSDMYDQIERQEREKGASPEDASARAGAAMSIAAPFHIAASQFGGVKGGYLKKVGIDAAIGGLLDLSTQGANKAVTGQPVNPTQTLEAAAGGAGIGAVVHGVHALAGGGSEGAQANQGTDQPQPGESSAQPPDQTASPGRPVQTSGNPVESRQQPPAVEANGRTQPVQASPETTVADRQESSPFVSQGQPLVTPGKRPLSETQQLDSSTNSPAAEAVQQKPSAKESSQIRDVDSPEGQTQTTGSPSPANKPLAPQGSEDHSQSPVGSVQPSSPIVSPESQGINRESAPVSPPVGKGEAKPGGPNQSLSAAGSNDPFMDPRTGTSSLQNLTDQIKKAVSNKAPVSDQIRAAGDVGENLQPKKPGLKQRVVDNVVAARNRLSAGMAAISNAYKSPPSDSTYIQAVRKWSGVGEISQLEARRYTQAVKGSVPNPADRAAIYAYIEAGGDSAKLKAQAKDLASNPETSKYAAAYEAAARLSPEHKVIAEATGVRNDATRAEMQAAGMMKDGVDNYMTHIWEKDPDAMRQVIGQSNLQSLTTNPSILKQRVLPDVYTGIKAGFKPKTMDFAETTALHELAMRSAMANRALIKTLYDGKATDGRPLTTVALAAAKELPATEENPQTAFLIKPNMKGTDNFADYRPIDHPSLRGWKLSTVDENGKPVIVQGDMLVHPQAYQHLKNNLTKSAIQTYEANAGGLKFKPGQIALRTGAELKNVILTMSGFHQATLGERAAESGTNPFGVPEINTSDGSLDRKLFMHGMTGAHFNMAEFAEGVSQGGLVTKIPGVGPKIAQYNDYLFNEYMPRLKAAFARNAYELNTSKYGKTMSDDQILNMSADQTNARFGGLNLKVLGRNRTFQDVLRGLMLAPDFTESAARTVGQAVRPSGGAQRKAIVVGAAAMYTACAALNTMISGNPYLDKPFKVVVDGKEYGMRTIASDVAHLVTSPLDFLEQRLSPPASFVLHMLTRTNKFNEKAAPGEIAKDAVENEVPIAAQPFISYSRDSNTKKTVDAILSMIGIQSRNDTNLLRTKMYNVNSPQDVLDAWKSATPQEQNEQKKSVLFKLENTKGTKEEKSAVRKIISPPKDR